MEFFYPNWINDFWRIQGLIHFGDKAHFEHSGEKRFDKERIVAFCREKGIALFDTARKVRRLKDNADDNFLEIVEGTELQSYLESHGLKVKIPKVGEFVEVNRNYTSLRWWRMPSSSRAYPMKLEKKAEYYRRLFE